MQNEMMRNHKHITLLRIDMQSFIVNQKDNMRDQCKHTITDFKQKSRNVNDEASRVWHITKQEGGHVK